MREVVEHAWTSSWMAQGSKTPVIEASRRERRTPLRIHEEKVNINQKVSKETTTERDSMLSNRSHERKSNANGCLRHPNVKDGENHRLNIKDGELHRLNIKDGESRRLDIKDGEVRRKKIKNGEVHRLKIKESHIGKKNTKVTHGDTHKHNYDRLHKENNQMINPNICSYKMNRIQENLNRTEPYKKDTVVNHKNETYKIQRPYIRKGYISTVALTTDPIIEKDTNETDYKKYLKHNGRQPTNRYRKYEGMTIDKRQDYLLTKAENEIKKGNKEKATKYYEKYLSIQRSYLSVTLGMNQVWADIETETAQNKEKQTGGNREEPSKQNNYKKKDEWSQNISDIENYTNTKRDVNQLRLNPINNYTHTINEKLIKDYHITEKIVEMPNKRKRTNNTEEQFKESQQSLDMYHEDESDNDRIRSEEIEIETDNTDSNIESDLASNGSRAESIVTSQDLDHETRETRQKEVESALAANIKSIRINTATDLEDLGQDLAKIALPESMAAIEASLNKMQSEGLKKHVLFKNMTRLFKIMTALANKDNTHERNIDKNIESTQSSTCSQQTQIDKQTPGTSGSQYSLSTKATYNRNRQRQQPVLDEDEEIPVVVKIEEDANPDVEYDKFTKRITQTADIKKRSYNKAQKEFTLFVSSLPEAAGLIKGIRSYIARKDKLVKICDAGIRLPQDPKIIVSDMVPVEGDEWQERFKDILISRNEWLKKSLGDKIDRLRVLNRMGRSTVIQLPKRQHDELLQKRRIKMDWQTATVSEYIDTKQCYKCLGFGHLNGRCSNNRWRMRCAKCGEDNHRARECKATKARCLNCPEGNNEHWATGNNCPLIIRAKKEYYKRIVDYEIDPEWYEVKRVIKTQWANPDKRQPVEDMSEEMPPRKKWININDIMRQSEQKTLDETHTEGETSNKESEQAQEI